MPNSLSMGGRDCPIAEMFHPNLICEKIAPHRLYEVVTAVRYFRKNRQFCCCSG